MQQLSPNLFRDPKKGTTYVIGQRPLWGFLPHATKLRVQGVDMLSSLSPLCMLRAKVRTSTCQCWSWDFSIVTRERNACGLEGFLSHRLGKEHARTTV